MSDFILWELGDFKGGHVWVNYYEANAKKEREKRLLEIQSVLPTLELAYQVSKSYEDYNKIVKLKV